MSSILLRTASFQLSSQLELEPRWVKSHWVCGGAAEVRDDCRGLRRACVVAGILRHEILRFLCRNSGGKGKKTKRKWPKGLSRNVEVPNLPTFSRNRESVHPGERWEFQDFASQ